ncbi:MAG: M48 family metalloprotease [Candidatus Omnitrophica bacterium]|nr:M48 family metalloprotease [Candidatus Omnitrophota bacterium]
MLIVLLLSIFLSACVSTEYNVTTHREDIMFYSADREVAMGQSVAKQVAQYYKISQNPFYVGRVKEMGAKIAEVCDRQEISYYFYVLERKEDDTDTEPLINAFALPGGYVYIFKDLMDLLDTEDELAFILAHEVGHVVARHSIKKLQAIMGYNLVAAAATQVKTGPGFQEGLSLAMLQILSAYSQEDEFDADELAVQYLTRLGYDPLSGIAVMEKLYEANKKQPRRPLMYFRTHPYAAQRIGNIKKQLGMPLDISDYMNK